MKKRRIIILAFMLIAVMVVGIGFAAYSTTLAIHGTTAVSAEALQFTEDVQFTSVTSSNEAFGTATIGDGQTATFKVDGMTQYNDRVQFTYTITNGSSYDVDIAITTHPTPASPSKCTVTTALSASTIPAGQSITATVTVVLNETVTAAIDPINWTIEYTATSVDPTP
jgi:hypothetical protein